MSENENNNGITSGNGIVARTVPMLLEHEMSKSSSRIGPCPTCGTA